MINEKNYITRPKRNQEQEYRSELRARLVINAAISHCRAARPARTHPEYEAGRKNSSPPTPKVSRSPPDVKVNSPPAEYPFCVRPTAASLSHLAASRVRCANKIWCDVHRLRNHRSEPPLVARTMSEIAAA